MRTTGCFLYKPASPRKSSVLKFLFHKAEIWTWDEDRVFPDSSRLLPTQQIVHIQLISIGNETSSPGVCFRAYHHSCFFPIPHCVNGALKYGAALIELFAESFYNNKNDDTGYQAQAN